MDKKLALLTGIDVPIEECQLIIHQPTIKEISFVGETDFFTAIQYLCVQKSLYKDLPPDTTNFSLFMAIMTDENVNKKPLILNVLPLFFPEYKVIFTPRAILFNLNDENFMIDEGNFEIFQSALETICCLRGSGNDSYNPGNDKAREIAEKLMRGRQRAAAQKAAEDGGADGIFSRYLSILTVGLQSMSLNDLMNCTIYQLYDLIERYSLYIGWDLDVRSRLAGGKPDHEPENWMKSIH